MARIVYLNLALPTGLGQYFSYVLPFLWFTGNYGGFHAIVVGGRLPKLLLASSWSY
jgi:hypothetical protein